MTMISAVLRRVAAALAAVLAVTAAFASGFLVAQGRGNDRPTPVRLAAAGLGSGLSCHALRQWYVDRGSDRVTAWGWDQPAYDLGGVERAGGDGGGSSRPTPRTAATPSTTSATGTNVQETGVDEPDVVKTSGGAAGPGRGRHPHDVRRVGPTPEDARIRAAHGPRRPAAAAGRRPRRRARHRDARRPSPVPRAARRRSRRGSARSTSPTRPGRRRSTAAGTTVGW